MVAQTPTSVPICFVGNSYFGNGGDEIALQALSGKDVNILAQNNNPQDFFYESTQLRTTVDLETNSKKPVELFTLPVPVGRSSAYQSIKEAINKAQGYVLFVNASDSTVDGLQSHFTSIKSQWPNDTPKIPILLIINSGRVVELEKREQELQILEAQQNINDWSNKNRDAGKMLQALKEGAGFEYLDGCKSAENFVDLRIKLTAKKSELSAKAAEVAGDYTCYVLNDYIAINSKLAECNQQLAVVNEIIKDFQGKKLLQEVLANIREKKIQEVVRNQAAYESNCKYQESHINGLLKKKDSMQHDLFSKWAETNGIEKIEIDLFEMGNRPVCFDVPTKEELDQAKKNSEELKEFFKKKIIDFVNSVEKFSEANPHITEQRASMTEESRISSKKKKSFFTKSSTKSTSASKNSSPTKVDWWKRLFSFTPAKTAAA